MTTLSDADLADAYLAREGRCQVCDARYGNHHEADCRFGPGIVALASPTGSPRADTIIRELKRDVADGDMTPARADWFRWEVQALVREAAQGTTVESLTGDLRMALAMTRLGVTAWTLPLGTNNPWVMTHAVQQVADDLDVAVAINPGVSHLFVELAPEPTTWQRQVAEAYASTDPEVVAQRDALPGLVVDAPSSPQEAPGQAEAPILGSVGTDDGWTATTMSYRGQSWRVFRTPGTSRKWTSSILVRGEWTVYEDEAPSKASALAAAKAASEDPDRYLRSVL